MDIDKLIIKATKEKNGPAKEAYRAIKAELMLIQTGSQGKAPRPTDDNDIIIVTRKLIKEREESISMYDANSRKELADMYREQVKYLKELIPPEIPEEKIKEAVVTAYPNGLIQKQMKEVMDMIKNIYPTADRKIVANVIKNYINESK